MTMERKQPLTYFDSPERTAKAIVNLTADDLVHSPLVVEMLETFPTPALLLDANRQIVAANGRALAAFDVMSPFDVHGVRLGEALGCVCAHKMDAGCGTSQNCAECGAAHAIRDAHGGSQTVRECRITTAQDGKERSFDFRVFATPMQAADHAVLLVALEDIGDEKRREALERIFFHDVLGAANAVHGLARLVSDADPQRAKDVAQSLVRATGQLLEEIQAQRDLLLAERGELATLADTVSMNEIVQAVHQQYRASPLAEGRELVCRLASPDRSLRTDRIQLIRSLGNLVRNALEGVGEGDRVTISAQAMADGVRFEVSNPGTIPAHLQLQIFQRSFSTKAPRGRGIGTYSVKLIVEQYLKGRVSFASSPDSGTVFSIWVPAELAATA
jgi:signal transduction histidine kinase